MPVLGMDLGGTKLAAALFSNDGAILHKETVAVAGRQGGRVGALVAETAQKMIAAASRESIEAVGVCIPGIYYAHRGSVWAPNIPGWDDYPLRQELAAALPGVRIAIDSDRACYILGETWQGIARGCRNAIFLAIGTGIGAGILIDGNILRGHNDIAGAVGWFGLQQPFQEKYRSCGCFEYHAAGEGLAKMAREYLATQPDYRGALRAKTCEQITAADLFGAYDSGDAIARRVLNEAIVYWGMAIANLVSAFNPEKIIFGGGVFGPAARFLDHIHAEAKQWAQPISFAQVELAVSTLGGDAGLIGAGRLALGA